MIKETTQLQGFNNIKLPKIKGEVEIRLHNPTTGKTEIHKGENMITNAISDIFASNLCGALDYRKCMPLWEKMFGGVLCFKRAFTEDEMVATDYYIPDNDTTFRPNTQITKGNPVTAHAGQSTVTDQSDDPTRGSMSINNMEITDGSAKLAWEWGLSEGNGDISALSLTHTDVGTGGTGSTSTAFSTITPNINSTALTASHRVYFADANNYGYDMSFSGNTLTLTRFPIAYKKVGLVSIPFDYNTGIPTSKTATLGTTHNLNPHFFFVRETSKLHLFYNTSASNNVAYDIVDISNWNNISVTSTTLDAGMAVGALSHDRGAIATPFDGTSVYLLRSANSRVGYVRINLSNVADKSEMLSTINYSSGAFTPNLANRVIVTKNGVINNNILYPTALESPDVINHYNNYNQWSNATLDGGVGLVQLNYLVQTTNQYYYPSISKFYLATKFNLPSMITKSPSQSMIVTYTLTEVAPND